MQIQKNKRTIQGEIQFALKKLFGFCITINYAGRTDAGVHALGQVIDFYTDKFLDAQVLKKALNALLKPQIRVLSVRIVPENFHSRYSCIFRDYVYIINTAEVCMPFLKNYVWHVPKLNILKLNEVKNLFVGFKDFGAFSKSSKNNKTQRFIQYIRIKQKNAFVAIFIRGHSFLRGMVRLIVGTMVAYAKGIVSSSQIVYALNNALSLSTIKAPASGLYFKRAIY